MDQVAEAGVAAHWIYKEDGGDGRRGPRKGGTRRYAWLRELVQEVRRQSDPQEFVESVKEDLTSTKEVFVFTPKGDLYALARGSSVLDFGKLPVLDYLSYRTIGVFLYLKIFTCGSVQSTFADRITLHRGKGEWSTSDSETLDKERRHR